MPAEKIQNISDLKKGDVITFNYMSGHDRRPTVLFLNYYKNLVHGLNLNYLSASQIAYLKIILGNELYSISLIENPKSFYDNQLKRYNYGFAYRTYTPSKLINLYRLGYKVQSIEKDTGLDKKVEDVYHETEQKYTTKPDIKSTIPDDFIEQITKTTIPQNIFGNFFEF